MIKTQAYREYVFGSTNGLSEEQVKHLSAFLDTPGNLKKGVLGGRGGIVRTELKGVGNVVIKPYNRGGLIRHINKKTHVRIRSFRSAAEFELTKRLLAWGVSVPEPVAWIVCGRIFYRAWLVTREIPEADTLADITDLNRTARLMAEVRRQVMQLVEHRVLHVDLHPGNVLIDRQDRIFLIDFDRAKTGVRMAPCALERRYERRWQRAVIKHGLSGCLIPLFPDKQ